MRKYLLVAFTDAMNFVNFVIGFGLSSAFMVTFTNYYCDLASQHLWCLSLKEIDYFCKIL